jgi:hypothetical protein
MKRRISLFVFVAALSLAIAVRACTTIRSSVPTCRSTAAFSSWKWAPMGSRQSLGRATAAMSGDAGGLIGIITGRWMRAMPSFPARCSDLVARIHNRLA